MDLGEVTITSKYNTTDGCLEVDFEGEDMGILIGKRGQTLDSLQYLTSLVVNKGKSDYIRVKLDTEDYRTLPSRSCKIKKILIYDFKRCYSR